MFQPILAGIIGALTGFASSFALVIAGLLAVGATPEEAASGLLALCIAQAIIAILLSWRYRMPLSFAWSTPGAALLIAAQGSTGSFSAAVGAFILCAALIVLSGLWPALGRAMTRIPTPIAAAMLAGILFPICLAPVQAAIAQPVAGLVIIVVWLVLYRLAPRWAAPVAMVVALVELGVLSGTEWMIGATLSPTIEFVAPTFDPLVLVSLGVPLYIVTMAGQNVPGFAVLTTLGYPPAPARAVLVSSGVMSGVAALFGGHALNLAALSAAIMAGPDSHPDRAKRWVAPIAGGVTYVALGLVASVATALVATADPILIIAVAGLAMLGAFTSGIVSAFEDPQHRVVAAITFLVVASGVVVAGIGSAFWGLVVGGIVMLWLGWRSRPKHDRTADPVDDSGPTADAS